MSVSEERMMILKMLQEGKINSDEAAKLLEALEGNTKQNAGCGSHFEGFKSSKAAQHNYYDEVAKVRERINSFRQDLSKNYNQKDFDKMVDEFSEKAEKFGKSVQTAAFGVADKVVDFVGSIVDTGAFNIFGSCVTVEKVYEAVAVEGTNIYLQATNGPITVKKHNEDRILINAKIRTPQAEAENAIAFTDENGTVSVKLSKPDTYNLSVSYDVFVPAVKFNKLTLETKNSKIYVEDTLSSEFVSITKNGAIDLAGVNSDKVTVDTKNAKVIATYLIGKDINISTKNAAIDIKNLKAEKLDASTINGKITLENLQNLENVTNAELILRTKNADIKANMNDSEDTGYKVLARTSNGGINLLIPNLLYRSAPKVEGATRMSEAETENYASAAQKVNIVVETQNGYIEVIK
ncbi:MAG: DUF4097 domain-containing protein [Clostridiaceae bacterium]|mgnify:CR=1 FL=1|jgi:DUF4097 and DUF4098 domain-containing protein YvlB|nr:DUF4097 domain-containing protein [Clostridiaceae bacterium]